MTSKVAIEIIDSILLAFDNEIRNKMLDYIDRGYDVCSGMAILRGYKWKDETYSNRKVIFGESVIDMIKKEVNED